MNRMQPFSRRIDRFDAFSGLEGREHFGVHEELSIPILRAPLAQFRKSRTYGAPVDDSLATLWDPLCRLDIPVALSFRLGGDRTLLIPCAADAAVARSVAMAAHNLAAAVANRGGDAGECQEKLLRALNCDDNPPIWLRPDSKVSINGAFRFVDIAMERFLDRCEAMIPLETRASIVRVIDEALTDRSRNGRGGSHVALYKDLLRAAKQRLSRAEPQQPPPSPK